MRLVPLGVSWAYLENIWGQPVAYMGHIFGILWAYLEYILAYLGHILDMYLVLRISWLYLGKYWAYLRHILGMYLRYLEGILGSSYAYPCHMLVKSLKYFGHIFWSILDIFLGKILSISLTCQWHIFGLFQANIWPILKKKRKRKKLNFLKLY